jgi:ABC-2 type transport system permease protein
MKKIWIIIQREYLVRVRTRAFLIGTVASPLLMLALIILPGFLATRGGGERRVMVLDQSNDPALFQAFYERVEGRAADDDATAPDPSFAGTRFLLSHVVVQPGQGVDEIAEREYDPMVKKDTISAYIILRPGVLSGDEPEYHSKNTSDFAITSLRNALSSAITKRRLQRAGFNSEIVTEYTKPVGLKRIKIGAEGRSEEDSGGTFIVAFIMLFFIYMSVLFYGLFVMRGVIEEKQSRIAEVLISSVKPTQMMLGKLIGIGLVGLTQITIWATSGIALSLFGASVFARKGVTMPSVPISLAVYFVMYFILGYFLYATLYAIVGATVSSDDESQQAQMPVTLVAMVPMMIFPMVMNNPSSPMSVALSMFPFFAPTLMLMRITVVNPPLWQVLLSMLIMVATILFCAWVAAKIYRVGILMYGKRPSIAELGRWLRYS